MDIKSARLWKQWHERKKPSYTHHALPNSSSYSHPMLEISKVKAKKLFYAIPIKQIGVVRATTPKKQPVTIITKKDKQVLRVCDGKYWA